MRLLWIPLATLALALPTTAAAAQLKPATEAAFERYVDGVEAQVSRTPADNPKYRQQARGEHPVVHHAGDAMDVPGGLIHDWVGTVFVPGARAEDVVHLLQDFNRHYQVYSEVVRSRVRSRGDDIVEGAWQLRKTKGTTVVLNVDMEARYRLAGNGRWFVSSKSTRVAEVKNAGQTDEHELPPGKQRGFLWRLNAYWWILPADDGVFVQCRTISLTRDAPRGLGWLVRPLIEDAPRESLISTLDGTRMALMQPPAMASTRQGY